MDRGTENRDENIASDLMDLLRAGLNDHFLMDYSVTEEMESTIDLLAREKLLKPTNSKETPIYGLPLCQTGLENFKNASCSKNSSCATLNEIRLPTDKSNRRRRVATGRFKENNLKENRNTSATLGRTNESSYSKDNEPFHEISRASRLHKQLSQPIVGINGSRMTQGKYHAKCEPYTEIQCLCATLLSDAMKAELKAGISQVMNKPLADDGSGLDLSTLLKRKNILVAPFCNEFDFNEGIHDDCTTLLSNLTDIEIINTDCRETKHSHAPILRRLLNGLKYFSTS